MRFIDLSEVFRKLGGVAVSIARKPLGPAEIVKISQTQIRKAAVAGKLRNPADAKLGRNAKCIRRGRSAGGVFLAIPEAHLVDERGGEDVGVTDCDTVDVECLCALVVSAAIGDSAKRRNAMLGVADVAVRPNIWFRSLKCWSIRTSNVLCPVVLTLVV